MDYKKPVMLAKSEPKRTFVAGCPEKNAGSNSSCKNCERTR